MSDLFDKGFCVRVPSWHGKETLIQDYPGLDEAMKIAGHDHQIVAKQLFMAQNEGSPFPLTEWKALVREDTNAVIAVKPSTYEIVQNRVPWELIDQLFQQGAKWDTAGLLKGRFDEGGHEVKGQVYWCSALLDEPKTILGDDSPTYPYIFATWDHALLALKIRASIVRIVCANTHHAAMFGEGRDFDVTIRHIGNVEERILKAKESLSKAREFQSFFMEEANALAAMHVSDAGIEEFISRVVPVPEADVVTDRVRRNVDNSRQELRDLFGGKTIGSGIRNTAYGMMEAGVEYFDHVRRSLNSDTYFNRNVMTVSKAKMALAETAKEVAMAFPN